MTTLNFALNRRQAFLEGFLRGLSAPLCLFGSYELTQIPPPSFISLEGPSIADALRSDWSRVGLAIDGAIKEYGQKAYHIGPVPHPELLEKYEI